MDETDEQILIAKVVMLERLVRALYKDTFLKANDPLAAVDAFTQRYTKSLEAGLAATARDGTEPHDLVALEMLAKFFDELRHDVAATLRNRGSK